MSLEIVKVQMSRLKANAPAIITPVNGDVRRQTAQRLTPDVVRGLGGNTTAYFKASFVDGKWQLRRQVSHQ